jgi:hypothetical protein
MVLAQLERLEKDSASLENFINELKKQGDNNRAEKIENKKRFLDNRIEQIKS